MIPYFTENTRVCNILLRVCSRENCWLILRPDNLAATSSLPQSFLYGQFFFFWLHKASTLARHCSGRENNWMKVFRRRWNRRQNVWISKRSIDWIDSCHLPRTNKRMTKNMKEKSSLHTFWLRGCLYLRQGQLQMAGQDL